MRIPDKAQHGANFKQWTIDTLNAIIDYLNASRLRNSPDIFVDETPSGTLVKLNPRAKAPVIQQIIAGSTASGLSATVSGGTAMVEISGSTALVIEPGANIQISGGTNGEIIISATGGGGVIGFPDYSKFDTAEYISLVNQQVTKTYTYPIWLIGEAAKNTGADMSCTITIDIGGKTIDLLSVSIGSTTLYGYVVPVCIPIPANTSFTLTASGGFLSILNVYALPCL